MAHTRTSMVHTVAAFSDCRKTPLSQSASVVQVFTLAPFTLAPDRQAPLPYRGPKHGLSCANRSTFPDDANLRHLG